MKKIAAVLTAGLVLVISGCGNKTDRIKEIQQAGVLRTAIVNSESQYTSQEETGLSGLEPELVEMIASALGVQPDYQVLEPEAALEAVSAGSADIAIGCIAASSTLTENYLYTTSYGKGFFYVVTQKGDFAQSAGDFVDSRVGLEPNLGADLQIRLSSAEGIRMEEYKNPEDAFQKIEDGTLRAYVCREEQAKQALSNSSLQVQNLFRVNPAEYVIVAGKDDQKLVSGMNSLITQFLTKEE